MSFERSVYNLMFSGTSLEDENARVLGITRLFSFASLIGLSALLGARIITGEYESLFAIFLTLVFLFSSYHLSVKGYAAASGSILVWSLFLLLLDQMIRFNGIHDSAVIAIPGVLVVAGLVLKKRYFYIYTGTVLLTIVVLGILSYKGVLRNKFAGFTSVNDIVDVSVIILLSVISIRVLSDNLAKSFKIARIRERKLNEQSKELRIAAANYKMAQKKAEQMSRLKTNFLTQMSHEIRTPLNTMLSFNSLLKMEMEDKVPADLQQIFNVIDSGGRRLSRTIDMMLMMSQFQTHTYEPSWSRINISCDILTDIYTEFQNRAQLKELDLEVCNELGEVLFNGDLYSVKNLFDNLVDNAIKYTMKGSVTVRLYMDEYSSVCLEVCDTGIGISEEYLKDLFNPFSQEETGYSRRFEGNGLGLALVKNYADLNNMEIKVTSSKENGTKFTTVFPADKISVQQRMASAS
ncbi:MAG: sensor histidine kinase [Syntrophothermus sp.]